jgi:hypothetical protein
LSAKNAILEIDGKRYDSSSGDYPIQKQRSIDGIMHSATTANFVAPARQPLHNIVTKPTMNDVVRSGVNPMQKSTQPSKTLMRQFVKKPTINPSKPIKSQSKANTLPAKKPAHHVSAKLSAATLDHVRAERALSVPKSQSVKHFHKSKHNPVQPSSPAQELKTPHHKQVHGIATKPHSGKKRTTTDIFEEAIAHATSHEQVHHAAKKKRVTKQAGVLLASFVAVMLVSAMFASQNMDSLKMHLAASKAGFAASLPGYKPDGYRLGSINSDSGIVATNFLSNTDKRSYTLTQKPSKWDSQALREVYVTKNSQDFYAVEKNGQTIFIYGDHQATWVDGGVWYQLSSNGSLSDKQLVDLAVSL